MPDVVIDTLTKERILQRLAVLAAQPKVAMYTVRAYDAPNGSDKLLRIILSYTDCVWRTVWAEMSCE